MKALSSEIFLKRIKFELKILFLAAMFLWLAINLNELFSYFDDSKPIWLALIQSIVY